MHTLLRFGTLFGLLGFGVYQLTRIRSLRKVAAPSLATSYQEAMDRLARLQAQETDAIHDLCRTRVLTHGHKTAQAIIFLHGFTNCPHQFHQLAQRFFDLGYNVLNARLPHHGLADRRAPGFAQLSAEDLIDLTNEAIDSAHGLGDQVTLLGFSLGGILAGWAAQHRVDLDQAVLVSPAVGLKPNMLQRHRLAANVLALWPDFFQWWDPVRKDAKMGPAHAYWGFSSRALAALLHIGAIVRRDAMHNPPLTRSILVITNPTDELVDGLIVTQLVTAWRRHGALVRTYEFPRAWNLVHDLMDPSQPEQQVERVYPQLIQWIVEIEEMKSRGVPG